MIKKSHFSREYKRPIFFTANLLKSLNGKRLSKARARLLESCGIPPASVRRLAKGYHHTVYTYTDPTDGEKVIKVTNSVSAKGIVHSASEERDNARVVAATFGSASVPTDVRESAEGYCVVMDKISGVPLHARRVDGSDSSYSPLLRGELTDIVERSKQLARTDGRFLDFTGARALFDEAKGRRVRELDNIFVQGQSGDERLRIVDNDLIPLKRGNPTERIKARVVFLANQRVLMREFGIDLRLRKPTDRRRTW